MTKKIFATLIAVMICLSAVISASAYTREYVIDYADNFASSEIDEFELFAENLENGYSDEYVYNDDEFVYAGEPKTEKEKNGVSIIWLPVSLLIGLLVGFLIVNGIASKNKSVKMQENATVYTRQGSVVITGGADNFLYKNLDRIPKVKADRKP